jgi:CoA:oxalate CoA-transferase
VEELPLAGLKVVDLTTFLAGPFATQLLGDLGAEVVKVESPGGDSSRAIPSHDVGNDTGYFLANNRNKKSVSVNLKDRDGQEVVRRLVLQSDVVIENYRPGVAARLGLDSVELTARNERLIWASISGFGQTGPLSDRPAYDMIVQALAGVMSLTGEPGGKAMRLGVPLGDVGAGLFAVIGILAAVASRGVAGRGRIIDVAMLDCLLAMLSYQGVYSLISGRTPQPQGARHDSIATYRSFVASDGREFVVTANTEQMWTALCRVIEQPALAREPRFASPELRLEHRHELWAALESAFAKAPAHHWVDRLVDGGVPAALINNVTEALDAARASGRGMIFALESDRGRFESLGTPIVFAHTMPAPRKYPPDLGGDTVACLRDAGFEPGEIARLLASGAVIDGRRPETSELPSAKAERLADEAKS